MKMSDRGAREIRLMNRRRDLVWLGRQGRVVRLGCDRPSGGHGDDDAPRGHGSWLRVGRSVGLIGRYGPSDLDGHRTPWRRTGGSDVDQLAVHELAEPEFGQLAPETGVLGP